MHYRSMLFIYNLFLIPLFLLANVILVSATLCTPWELLCQRLPGMSVEYTPYKNKNILLAAFTAGTDEDVHAFITRYNTCAAEDNVANNAEVLRSCAPQLLFLYAHYIALGGHSHPSQMNTSDIYFDILSGTYGLKADKAISLKHLLYDMLRQLPAVTGRRTCCLTLAHKGVPMMEVSTVFSFAEPFKSSDMQGPWEDEEIATPEYVVDNEVAQLTPPVYHDLVYYSHELLGALKNISLLSFSHSPSHAEESESMIAEAEKAAAQAPVVALRKNMMGTQGLQYLVTKQQFKNKNSSDALSHNRLQF